MKKTLILLFMVMGSVALSNAQNSQFHAGLGFPNGHFGEDDRSNDKSGNAALGFNIGFKQYKPLSTENLSIVFGIDAFYNDLTSDTKDYYEKNYNGYDITFNKYLNAPATIGLNYGIPIDEKIKLYAEGAIGMNCSYVTPLKVEKSGIESKLTYTPAFGFCYGFEGGVLIQDKYTIGLKYNQLGTYKYKYKQKTTGNGQNETNKGKFTKQPVSIISLTAGVKF